ncbi:asparagine synthase [Rathayibacter tanaceti]|uniref:Asparagine synthase n=3 Tax=Rathayibacter tanaceti TaxID=1671680 RepID=A0AAE6V640_9MICO|nr:asparagine synthase [Rathayibacter tanaceti]QHC55702.1 asparagine synthase [Rathayibacter tanaceti]
MTRVWFRRRRRLKMQPYDPDENPSREPVSVEEAAEEGLMLAQYASRMAVKNRVLMDGLGDDVPFDVARYSAVAASELEKLARESEVAAERLRGIAADVTSVGGRSDHVHDYRSADVDNLDHREQLSLLVADSLRRRAHDEEYLASLVDDARQDAWRELAQSIEETLDRATRLDPDTEEYRRDRSVRMALVVVDDLAKLAEERGRALGD